MQPLLGHDPLQVGPYRILGRLGSGGMGAVYAGLSGSGERVAVKVIHLELAHDPEFRSRFAREIALMARVRGACTVPVLAADPAAPRPWLATEYVPGPTLDERVCTAGPLTGNDLYGLASGLAEALVAIHAAGVLHRDLKPSNVVLSPSGPRVLDLGIARALDETSVTRTGILLGSPAWISPEHYRDEEVGPASDVYAWGLLIAFASTGRYPYGTGRPEVLAVRVLNNEVDLAGVPGELSPLVAATVVKKPDERPPASEVLDGVTTAWRDGLGIAQEEQAEPDSATSLIQRTWLMPADDDVAWAMAPAPPKRKGWLLPVLMVVAAVLAVVTAVVVLTAVYVKSIVDENEAAADPVSAGPLPVQVPSAKKTPRSPSPIKTDSPMLNGIRVSMQGGSSVVAPEGWTLRGGEGRSGTGFCLLSPGHKGDGCMNYGISFDSWDDPAEDPDIDDPQIWTGGSDVGALPQCFDGSDFSGPGITSATVSFSGFRPMADRTAAYREYNVVCGSLAAFEPRVWLLPVSRFMMTVVALSPRYRQMVDQVAESVLLD